MLLCTHSSAQALGTIPFPIKRAWSIEVGRAQCGLEWWLQSMQYSVLCRCWQASGCDIPALSKSGVPTTWPSSFALHEACVTRRCTPPRPCDMKHELLFTAGLLDELWGRIWPHQGPSCEHGPMRLGLGCDPHHLERCSWTPSSTAVTLKIGREIQHPLNFLWHPLHDCFLAVLVASRLQRQPALQRYWRSSCHGPWKPSRKPGARLIQTLQFIDRRCCH